jgi:hypothetical protein
MSPHQLSPLQGSHIPGQQPEDTLLDALLRACQPKPSVKPLPGFGRDLQPYFTQAAVPELDDAHKPRRSRGNNSPQKEVSGSPKRVHNKKVSNKRTLAEEKTVQLNTVPANAANKKVPNKKATLTTAPPTTEVAAILTSWAGPGFYNPPPPEHLPMPSMVLLG